ncbi:MAG TPA: TonB-dependent receptor plug domain-containing protein, partial [Longimicrobiaceae bacterium]|nr:TonB-dependent receptor plug domain-containing protein [Longimicrobiaceae bacterium]
MSRINALLGSQWIRGLHAGFVLAAALGLGLGLPSVLEAQARGTVAGRVVEAESLRPIEAAQVFIAGTGQGTLTNADGRYVIVNTPAGTHDITVARLGFRSATQVVTVTADATGVVDFQLSGEVLGLDEVVVTGTAGQARRREIGNSISQIITEDEIFARPADVEEMLQSRVPGVSVTLTSGVVGDGADIRIRGTNSRALSNAPLIYVDGVRMQSDRYDLLSPVILGTQYSHQARPSPLQDLNPDDIERIEVIKGAAATTLYGSEAATGVIQIFTKRGRTGTPEWTSAVELGVNRKNFFGIGKTLRGTPVKNFPRYRSAAGGSADYMYLDPWMRENALQQNYSSSVRG